MTRFGSLAALAAVLIVAVIVIPAIGDEEQAASRPAAGFEDTVARALPSVVQIRSKRGLGSGVVFDDAGHIVTNAHVVEGAHRFRVTAADGSHHAGTLRGTFREGDLAVIDVHDADLEPARFADSSKVRVGEIALAIGNPLGFRSSVTQGIVSSTSRTVGEGNGIALPAVIQTSAAINPGNSGGALVDLTGAVIGVPTLAALDPEMGGTLAPGIGFAISSNTVKLIAGQLAANGRVLRSERAWLGVTLRTLPQGGVLVAGVTPGGPAAAAGIARGDFLVRLGRRHVRTADDVALALARERPGRRVPVELKSAGPPRTVQVTLGEIPPPG